MTDSKMLSTQSFKSYNYVETLAKSAALTGITLLCTLGVSPIANAGIIRHDVSDWRYTNLANYFPSVGDLGIGFSSGSNSWCSGTLISANYMLTAAHCMRDDYGYYGNSAAFNLGGSIHWAHSFSLHNGWNPQAGNYGNDLAIIRLSNPVSHVAPATLYSGDDEDLKIGTYVGFGDTGTGITGVNSWTGKRAGENIIGLGSRLGYANNLLVSDFDDPRLAYSQSLSQPLELEYQLARGDSGGGLFIDGKLAGVHSFTSDEGGKYGATSASGRVSLFRNWITGTINMMTYYAGDGKSSTPNYSGFNGSGQWASDTSSKYRPEFDFEGAPLARIIDNEEWAQFLTPPSDDPQKVPEPGTVLGLIAFGIASVVSLRKRKQQHQENANMLASHS